MKKFFISIFLFSLLFISAESSTAGVPTPKDSAVSVQSTVNAIQLLKSMNKKQVQTLVGRRLNFKEKVGLFILKRTKDSKLYLADDGPVRSKKGKAALILGISAFVLAFIPVIGILSIPAAILAIIFGSQASKANKADAQGKTGMILGIIFLGLLVLLVLAVLAFLSAFYY